MSALEFKLDAFEGPLDLLLHLISKHKLNIYDIEISLLLDQYLEYIEGLEEQDFDTAGDFLAMAARLVYIKTCSLLPQPEEAEEMKRELQGELLDYSACKAAAARLKLLSVYGEVFVRPPEKLPVNKVFTGTIDPQMLLSAYLGMNAKTRSLKPVKAEQFSPLVSSRFVTVTSKIIHVLKRLLKSGECAVAELYEGVSDKSSRVATFLAVLELAKSGRITLNDDNSLISFNRSALRKHPAKPSEPVEAASEGYELPQAEEDTLYETADEQEDYDDYQSLPEEAHDLPAGDEPINDKPANDKPKTASFRIALETISPRHSLAIPALALFSREQPVGGVQDMSDDRSDTSEREALPDISADTHDTYINTENTETVQPFAVRVTINNRFAVRRYWGYPKGLKNCWSYRRERV